jgi:diaminopimelate epimerase
MDKNLCVPFQKFHGLGNDFIVSGSAVVQPGAPMESDGLRELIATAFRRKLARAICDRHTGIGADGFLLVQRADQRGYDAAVRFFNADGSEAEMSGNGIRCVGAALVSSGAYKSPLRIWTLAGVKLLELVRYRATEWQFRVRMGPPVLEPQQIPFAAKSAVAPVVGYTLASRLGKHRVTVTSMGNPHCSIFVKNFDRINWPEIGREIEVHPFFPNRTNVEFVRIISRRQIQVRFWERGVGITASSGTGSCAAAVASILNGFTERKLRVETTAGNLRVGLSEGGEVMLTGPAVKVAEGTYYS